MSTLDDIVDRAIEYTIRILTTMPAYRQTSIDGLRKLRTSLAEIAPDEDALAKLDAYLESLNASG